MFVLDIANLFVCAYNKKQVMHIESQIKLGHIKFINKLDQHKHIANKT